jgi:hypothetical protein
MKAPMPDEYEPRAEADLISGRTFWGASAVSAVVLCASTLVAGALLHLWSRGSVRDLAPAPTAPPQIGIVEQSAILDTRRGLDEQARQRESLRGYGWRDRQHHIVKLPIERAMDLAADADFMRRAFPRDGGT